MKSNSIIHFYKNNFIHIKSVNEGGVFNLRRISCYYVFFDSNNFQNCSSDSDGGVFYVNEITIWYNVLWDNYFNQVESKKGGGVYYARNFNYLFIEFNKFVNCSSFQGGAVYLTDQNPSEE